MQEGCPADFVIVILEGRVIISVDENGWERILAERGPGELVGERGGLPVRMRSASVIATERVRGLMDTSGASLGLIATTFVYETVIKHDRSLTGYRKVQVDVKTFSHPAWMNVIGTPVSPGGDPYAAVA
jgi:Cyclic nucleotide-binding domain